MMQIRVGCCGFPERRPDYFREFRVVEVQRTFYHPPRLTTLERWRREAPPDFEFTLKAWQRITHAPESPTYRKRGVATPPAGCGAFRSSPEVAEAWKQSRAAARALGARWVLFQCPASFRPTPENVENLERFFSGCEREGLGLAWEPRGEWPEDLVAALCRTHRLVHAVDPLRARPLAGEAQYFRLHGPAGVHSRYAPEQLRALRERIDPARAAYVLFNNAPMLEDARAFLRLLAQ